VLFREMALESAPVLDWLMVTVELHVHHIVPLSKGGTNDLDNPTTPGSQCHSMTHRRMGSG